ncbi:xanthine dehydrogenase large subunit [Devosia crocina]|uniref:Xanthine dehydrogenase large subunit n=1 Tax=Devosia crocina TaxID=429728 RepID=A0A1I7NVN4_9HYPH|nr:xanthine dehydrogenase molybdopterin binding subunit [Devosia crocina]SFV38735.1 xanthine dehydrogenase large subunit [Devosia crocina]
MDDLLRTGLAALDQVVPHESAHKHVAGTAEYIDDIIEPQNTLHAYLGLSSEANALIRSVNLDRVKTAPGVVGVLTAADIVGINDISPAGTNDDTLFCDGRANYHGQPIFAVVATSREAARRAARLAVVDYAPEAPHLTVAEAIAGGGATVGAGLTVRRGDIDAALAAAGQVIEGRISIGGQEHFYLEGQVSLALPGEDGEVLVYSATQHPGDVQEVVARILGLESNGVRVHVRRMGGAFGGKETQGTLFGAVAALAARKFRRAVKCRPDRDDDMVITGKRHEFEIDYAVGFDDAGVIEGVRMGLHARCGHSLDLSRGVADRAVMHADNAYFYPSAHVQSTLHRTHTVSNTAFRGYGGPQAIIAAERVIEEIAYALGEDPLEIAKRNFYDDEKRNTTHFGQPVTDNIMARIVAELEASSAYQERRAEIIEANQKSEFIKRGIALSPIKYGIGYSKKSMNQGAALLVIYRDGSMHINHGGTEMGQGLNTKVAQLVAAEFGLPLKRVRATAAATDKVPNASPTSGSTGTDLNGAAAVDAARRIKRDLVTFAADAWKVHEDEVGFENETVRIGSHIVSWHSFTEAAYAARVPLSATGFHKVPHIHWDRNAGQGSPYGYFTYGASCSEVAVDTLTGEYVVLRTDILQDVGRSVNRDIDLGQIEGGFIQGMGWLTTEELWWDKAGRLRTHAPSTYKIPLASDRPRIFNVDIAEWSINKAPTVNRSKAVGEPPIMLANSVFGAIGMAVASVADYRFAPRLDTPATPERVLMAMQRLKEKAGAG